MVQPVTGIIAGRLGSESERIGSAAASTGHTNGCGSAEADTAVYDGRGVVCRYGRAGAAVGDNGNQQGGAVQTAAEQ